MAGPQAAGSAGGPTQHTQIQAPDSGPAWVGTREEQIAALQKLREPFPDSAISKRPQPWCGACKNAPTKACDKHTAVMCKECGQKMTTAHTHLDYVGHAEATARLLDTDPLWSWEPLSLTEQGLPLLDQFGGMWMRLTVCGMTRLGYGDAAGKSAGPHAIKEIIGDGIRNAGMRFGMALNLWSKTDIHAVVEPEPTAAEKVLERLKDGRVWNSVRGLRVVRQQALDEGVLDFVVEDWDWFTLEEIIDRRLRELEAIVAEREAKAAARSEQAAEAAAQIAAEHGVQAPPPSVLAASVGSAGPEPAAGGATPAATVPASQAPYNSQPVPAVPTVEELAQKVKNGWENILACEQTLLEAQTKGLAGEFFPGDPRGRKFGELLRGRINALRADQKDQRNAAVYEAADNSYPTEQDQRGAA